MLPDSLNLTLIVNSLLFLTTIADETFTIKDVFYYFTMAIVLGLGFQAFYYLRYLPFNTSPEIFYDGGFNEYLGSAGLFMYVVIGTMVTDIGAYFFGVLFGAMVLLLMKTMTERNLIKKIAEWFMK